MTDRTRCRSNASSRCCAICCDSTRLDAKPASSDKKVGTRHGHTTDTNENRSRPRAQGSPDRGRGHHGAHPSARRELRSRRQDALRVSGPRHRHGDGQVGHHLPQNRGHAGQHGHVRILPASSRSDARRSRGHPAGGCAAGDLAQRRNAGSAAAARSDPADRRAHRGHHRQSGFHARPVGRCRPSTARSRRKPAR